MSRAWLILQLQVHTCNTEAATQKKLSIPNPDQNKYIRVKFMEYDIVHLNHVIA